MNVRAYAKINIGLRILGRRTDGYHDIETVFHQIDLYDELLFEPAETVKLTVSSPEVPCDSTNLCVRAAHLFQEHTGHREGINIHLTKRVPVGAGLGGGSSDAAAVFVALNKLWKTGMQVRELETMAVTLGSDIPFFVQGGTASGTSRGEVLDHFNVSVPYWILTATPPVHISTAWAYSKVRSHANTGGTPLRTLAERLMADPDTVHASVRNDFEVLVFQSYPEIRRLKENLEQTGAIFAQLSGSGSSVFGFFRDGSIARTAMAALASTCATSLTPPDFKPFQTSFERNKTP